MKKITVNIIVFVCLLCLASSALAVQIPNPLQGVNNFGDLLQKIIEGVGGVIAALGTIMLIVAGIFYLTSAGSTERLGTAKKALLYAIVGIVIGIAAAVIVEVIKTVIGAPK